MAKEKNNKCFNTDINVYYGHKFFNKTSWSKYFIVSYILFSYVPNRESRSIAEMCSSEKWESYQIT